MEEYLFKNYKIILRFKLEKQWLSEKKTKWNLLKDMCESKPNNDFIKGWLDNCSLLSNQNLQILNDISIGIQKYNNYKYIKFRHIANKNSLPYNYDDDIVLNVGSSIYNNYWSLNSLDDLLLSFIKMLDYELGTNCTIGNIELIK